MRRQLLILSNRPPPSPASPARAAAAFASFSWTMLVPVLQRGQLRRLLRCPGHKLVPVRQPGLRRSPTLPESETAIDTRLFTERARETPNQPSHRSSLGGNSAESTAPSRCVVGYPAGPRVVSAACRDAITHNAHVHTPCRASINAKNPSREKGRHRFSSSPFGFPVLQRPSQVLPTYAMP